MRNEIEKTIKVLAERAIEKGSSADAALKFTQAAANIANAGLAWVSLQRSKPS